MYSDFFQQSRNKPLAIAGILTGRDKFSVLYSNLYKDQREIMALSLQLEFCTATPDIVFGSQFIKDNEMVTTNYRTGSGVRSDLHIYWSDTKVKVYDPNFLPDDRTECTTADFLGVSGGRLDIQLGTAGKNAYYITDGNNNVLLAFNRHTDTDEETIWLNCLLSRDKTIYTEGYDVQYLTFVLRGIGIESVDVTINGHTTNITRTHTFKVSMGDTYSYTVNTLNHYTASPSQGSGTITESTIIEIIPQGNLYTLYGDLIGGTVKFYSNVNKEHLITQARYGDSVWFEITANPGYEIPAGMVTSGYTPIGEDFGWTFPTPTSAHKNYGALEHIEYTFRIRVVHGTVTGWVRDTNGQRNISVTGTTNEEVVGTYAVEKNGSYSFTFTPQEHYHYSGQTTFSDNDVTSIPGGGNFYLYAAADTYTLNLTANRKLAPTNMANSFRFRIKYKINNGSWNDLDIGYSAETQSIRNVINNLHYEDVVSWQFDNSYNESNNACHKFGDTSGSITITSDTTYTFTNIGKTVPIMQSEI